ncbi:hypothetical protein C0993_006915 [Termitomyces sp. T159_Od127]|nr:hypothetical protein C0993_006915 [Termitomyces sp. T159_Od127]
MTALGESGADFTLLTPMLAFLYYLGAVILLPTNVLGLWPIPRNLELGTRFLKLAPTFDIEIKLNNAPQDLLDAVSRTKGYLQTDKLQRLVVGRGEKDSSAIGQALELSSLTISLSSSAEQPHSIATEATLPIGMRSEGYSLDIPSDGSPATLTANSTLGLFRGLTTFSQLCFTVADIKRTLDAMSWVKVGMPTLVRSGWSRLLILAGQLRLASSATANFTAELISSIAQTLPSTLFSTGGDELNTNCYAKDAQTQADLSSNDQTLEQALSLFVQSTHKPLIDLGKTPVVWEEMVLDHNVTLPETAVVINSWCDPFKTWQKVYQQERLLE